MPEAQALMAIVLDPQKGCQPRDADNLFMYTDDGHYSVSTFERGAG